MNSTHENNTNHESGEIRQASPGEEQAHTIETALPTKFMRQEPIIPQTNHADEILNISEPDNNENSISKLQSRPKNLKSTAGMLLFSASVIAAFSTFINFDTTGTPLISQLPVMANTTPFNERAQRLDQAVAPNTVTAVISTQGHQESNPPMLQGGTNGTIGPQEERFSEGYIETCGTVRVNNRANLEALLLLMSNGIEILCIAWGGATLVLGLRDMSSNEASGMPRACLGTLVVLCGLSAPGALNWMVTICRDLCLFN